MESSAELFLPLAVQDKARGFDGHFLILSGKGIRDQVTVILGNIFGLPLLKGRNFVEYPTYLLPS
jgi:hypothetical protein